MASYSVLHIIYSATFGGIEKVVLDLSAQQKHAEIIEPTILVLKGEGEFIERIADKHIQFIKGGVKSGFDIHLKTYRNIYQISKQFDIIHFHGYNLPVSICAIVSGKKIVYTEHGNFGFGRKLRVTDKVNFILRGLFVNHFIHYFTCNSEFSKTKSTERYGANPKNCKVIYNGLQAAPNVAQITTPDQELNNNFIVGIAARFAGVKRIDLLIKAFHRFQKNKDNVRLMLVGDGVLMDSLKKLTQELSIEDKVIFTGYTNHPENYQSLFNICVLPSKNEAFGLAALECLALGMPVVVMRDGGGITEIIEKKFPDDIATDISDLTRIMNDYYYRKRNTEEESRKQLAQEFSLEKMAAEFNNVYSQIIHVRN